MQGRKTLEPKLLYTVSIEQLVPKDNFYRKLQEHLDLHWLYAATAKYYGSEGQESIDPVVFFKICLVGYLNGILSDRKLAEYCADTLSVRLFLGYDIDENIPWHSTISRTRQLYGEEHFNQLFNDMVKLCIDKGMVSGHTQAIDSALIKANASMDSLEVKEISTTVEEHLKNVLLTNNRPERKAKNDRADEAQKKMQGTEEEQKKKLEELNTRYERQKKNYKEQPGDDRNGKFLSNKTHYSPVDPDSRIAVKPGKPRLLYYAGQMAVDSSNHVITHMQATPAEGRDGKDFQEVVNKTQERLKEKEIFVENILADAAYSSGENYKFLEEKNLNGYIPLPGGALSGSEGFIYDKEKDIYLCPNNKTLKGNGKMVDDGRGHPVKKYFSLKSDCAQCPLKTTCLGKKTPYKKIQHSIHIEQLNAAKTRAASRRGQYMKRKRSATVEPVWGTLINFFGLRKINARGLPQANKIMLMAATVYNLKKYLRFISRKQKTHVVVLERKFQNGDFLSLFFQPFHDFIRSLIAKEKFPLLKWS